MSTEPKTRITQRTQLHASYLEEIRHKDPQGTIDRIFERKEVYKQEANDLRQQLHDTLDKVVGAESTAFYWHYRWDGERRLRNIALGLLAISLMAFVYNFIKPHVPFKSVPVGGLVQQTPSHVLASVLIYDDKRQGSGTVISKGDKYALILTAAHTCPETGKTFWVYFPDGTYTQGTVLAKDDDIDLGLARVDASSILEHSYVPEKLPDGDWYGVGYTQGEGPNRRSLEYSDVFTNAKKLPVWSVNIKKGPFGHGDSGSGVFVGEALVGVSLHKSKDDSMLASTLGTINKFLGTNRDFLKGCGDWTKAPDISRGGAAPPLWIPKPNVPIFVETKADREIKLLRKEIEALRESRVEPKGTKRPSEIK